MRRMYSQKQIEALAKQVADFEIENAEIHLNQIVAGTGEQGIVYVGDGETSFLPASSSDENKVVLIDEDGNPKLASSFAETMTGYGVANIDEAITPIYYSVCKNGNKLSFVFFGEITPTVLNTSLAICSIAMPTSIGAKLFPSTIAGIGNAIDLKSVQFIDKAQEVVKYANVRFSKYSDSNFTVYIMPNAPLTIGNTYVFRYEATFLLSDNLVS